MHIIEMSFGFCTSTDEVNLHASSCIRASIMSNALSIPLCNDIEDCNAGVMTD